MKIDWNQAPEGTTHGMVNGGEMRWYRVGEHVECWHTKYREWIRSFFLSIEEVRDSGLYLYANGEQSEIVMLQEQREMLVEALKIAKDALAGCYDVTEWPANGDTACDHAIQAADKAIAFVEGTK